MKILYFDCSMGAAGDMLTGALLDLFDNKEDIINELNSLGIPGVKYSYENSVKCGIRGTRVRVKIHDHEEHDHHHCQEKHNHYHGFGVKDIVELVDSFTIADSVKNDIKEVYSIIADAESQVHGKTVDQIHFHEVGSLDAIADVTAVCYLIDKLGVESIMSSSIHVGAGTVKCTHGILPVPAPSTALILKGCPIYSGDIMTELCTPTGAALLKYYVNEFGSLPLMVTDKIGYGMGTKEFDRANCVRAMLGENDVKMQMIETAVSEICCNVDDMTAEEIGFALECLYEEGAKEAYTVAANMKKNRPGWELRVVCDSKDKDRILQCIFKHTSTIGVREYLTNRYVLNREIIEHDTPYGTVREKISEGYGIMKSKLEYEDLSRIARENGLSVGQTRNLVITSLSD